MMNATRKQLLVSGIIQLIIGSFCLIFGICERASADQLHKYTMTSIPVIAIWMGLWIGITGVLGILTKIKTSFKPMIGVYLGFTITSIVFAAAMIIMYSLSIAFYYGYSYYYNVGTGYVMVILILILSILEFGIGIWASVCCCVAFSGRQPQTVLGVGQVVYMQTPVGSPPTGYVIVQGPDGNPVAVPAQIGGPMTEQSGIPPHYGNPPVQQPQRSETKVPF